MAFDENGDLNPWYYEMQRLGYNYRVTDIQAALGMSQLERLEESVNRRNQLADYYRPQLEMRFPDRSVRPLMLRHGRRGMRIISSSFESISRSTGFRDQRSCVVFARRGSGLRFTTSRFTCSRTIDR